MLRRDNLRSRALVAAGSLQDIVSRQDKPDIVAQMYNVKAIVLLDTSGSMSANANYETYESCYDVAIKELMKVQDAMPGEVMVFGFSRTCEVALNGIPEYEGQNTDLTNALETVYPYDAEDMVFVVISDGEPDDERSALKAAASFKGTIHVIYIGPKGSFGEDFLQRLSKTVRGKVLVGKDFMKLAANVTKLLMSGK